MRVIPVLDVRRRQAVRAIAGDRDHYGPLRSILHDGTDPIGLARAAIDAWNLPDLYLADLDAILGEARPDEVLYRALRDLGLILWVDAGVRGPGDLPPLQQAGVERIIVGLETVRGPEALSEVVAEAGRDRVVFSLDLHRGRPMVETRDTWRTDRVEEIAARAIRMGVRRMILLDLARVGTGLGVARLDGVAGESGRDVEWIVGGGIATSGEIRSLRRGEVQGVLVGSALHDGRITVNDLESINR